ncbi:MAG: Ig-like domain-containing protein, partial [Candidatus Cloacimonetes bacterium]|nr:Ig-like domain-containing protein [Candidatus Cloacimonadota bacterium]
HEIRDKKGNIAINISKNFDSKGVKDNIPPRIINSFPKNGSVINTTSPDLNITFDKIMFSDSIFIWIREVETNDLIPVHTKNKAGFTFLYNPLLLLKEFNTYQLIISTETADINGNQIEDERVIQFIVTQ